MSEEKRSECSLHRIVKLKQATGIDAATCLTCAHGYEEWDGDYSQHYCGMGCRQNDRGGYLEDHGIDPATEHDCWEPDFWHSNQAMYAAKADESDDGFRAFEAACQAALNALTERREASASSEEFGTVTTE